MMCTPRVELPWLEVSGCPCAKHPDNALLPVVR
jgi:hypothetical protein